MARTGIGAAYVQRQMAKGRSMASIQQEAASKGYQVGAKAQAIFSGGGGSPPAPAYSAPSSPSPTARAPRTGIGAAYVERERAKGRSLASIQQEAKDKGYQVGAQAQALFSGGGGGGGASSGGARTGIGAAYVQQQMAQGRSLASIQQEAKDKGYQIGDKAQAMFSTNFTGPPPKPWIPGASHGQSSGGARTGIGATYVQQQMDQGRSLASIQQEAKDKGYQIGAKAQEMFSGSPSSDAAHWQSTEGTAPLDWLKSYRGPQGGRDSKSFGAAALQRARDAGRSDADIQSQITAGGWNLGPAAQQALGGGGSVQDALQGKRNIWAHYNPESSGGWGGSANTRALQAGMTRSEIRSQLAESGLKIGEEAAKDLNVHAQQTTHIRPDHIQDKQDGYNTRYVMMPRDVRVNHLNFDEGDPRKYSTGAYSIGGYSDAAMANLFRDQDATWEGPWKHGTRGTYQDADWDYNIGGGAGVNINRPNFYWPNADREALATHDDSWRGHDYDGRDVTPTMAAVERGDVPGRKDWKSLLNENVEETYNETFREAGKAIASSTSTPSTSTPADNVVKAEDSVLDNDKPVVEVINKDKNPLASGSSSGRPGTHAPYHLATGSQQYYQSRFG